MGALYSSNIGVVPEANAQYFKGVLAQLKEFGLLLESDPSLPSVTAFITGGPVRGSWWSHPLAHSIFHVNGLLEDHPDVLVTKLVASKVTFVHRKLWPEILAIGTAREQWQTDALSATAQVLLDQIEANGWLRTDELVPPKATKGSTPRTRKLKSGDAARELERKLLVNAAQVHTESGAHAKWLETWEHWAKRTGFGGPSLSVAQAKRKMEARIKKLNAEFNATARLPWET